tara:strand:+ start:22 stop:600 length:579 start_codon:yes stop_codon:yes gene_type:complete
MSKFKLTDFIVQKNVISKELCKEMIEVTANEQWQTHKWYVVQDNQSVSHEDKELDVLFPDPVLTDKLFDIVAEKFGEYFNACNPLHSQINFIETINNCCGIRLNRYSEGTMMRPHFDHIHSLFDGMQKGIPAVSMIGVLNDDYEGGDLVFFDDYKIKTQAGDLIMFPSCFLYPHAIEEVTKGTRYSFVSWAW